MIIRHHFLSRSVLRGPCRDALEDETSQINLVVWPGVAERQRRVVLHARLLIASGTFERDDGEVVHLIAGNWNITAGCWGSWRRGRGIFNER